MPEQPQLRSRPVVTPMGSAEEEDIHKAYKLGADFCLIKPATLDGLVTIVQTISVS